MQPAVIKTFHEVFIRGSDNQAVIDISSYTAVIFIAGHVQTYKIHVCRLHGSDELQSIAEHFLVLSAYDLAELYLAHHEAVYHCDLRFSSCLLEQYPYERETIRGILDLLVDTYCSKRKYIRVAGDDKPADVVKSQIAKLNSSHIQYVMDCLKENTTDVRNIKQYLLAALYNAPTTISPYYQAKVNYDFYGNHD